MWKYYFNASLSCNIFYKVIFLNKCSIFINHLLCLVCSQWRTVWISQSTKFTISVKNQRLCEICKIIIWVNRKKDLWWYLDLRIWVVSFFSLVKSEQIFWIPSTQEESHVASLGSVGFHICLFTKFWSQLHLCVVTHSKIPWFQ